MTNKFIDIKGRRRKFVTTLRRIFWDRRIATVGLTFIFIVTLFAVLPNIFATKDPIQVELRDYLQPPSGEYKMGTDYLGRDIYSRVVYGSRVTLIVATTSVVLSAFGGITLGLISGYYRGAFDRLVLTFVDVGMAIPTLFLAILVIAVLGKGLPKLIIAIAIAGLPRYISLVRPQVISLYDVDYVVAGRALGASSIWVMLRHVVPSLLSSIIVLTSNRVAQAILTESSLNFLGLGISPPDPTWGNMIAEGRTYLSSAPWFPLFPGFFIMITVLGFNLIGDGLRDALDPKLIHERK